MNNKGSIKTGRTFYPTTFYTTSESLIETSGDKESFLFLLSVEQQHIHD
jgi:hypothetical protein